MGSIGSGFQVGFRQFVWGITMYRFSIKLLGLAVAFVAGWLFSNEVRAPMYNEISMQVWIVAGLLATLLAGVK